MYNKFGHKIANFKSNVRRSGNASPQGNTCYNYNKRGHVAKFCKRNVRPFGSQNKVDQIKKEMEKIWVKKKKDKEDDKVKDGSIPQGGANSSSRN